MGMFDHIRSSYPLGEDFEGQCQTKEIDDFYSGTMSQYWISPSGELYLIDYSHTVDFVELNEGDDGYNEKYGFLNFEWIPNGSHGKVTPQDITKYVRIYPENWKGSWEDWPECRIHFRNGKLQDFTILTKGSGL